VKPPPDPASVRRLLVRANNWIGDVVMASPALHALRRRFPGAHLSVLASPSVVPALEGSPDLDRLIVLEPRRESGMAGRARLIRLLRRERFDLAILFQKAFEAAFLAWAAGISRRYGYATDGRSWLLTDHLAETDAVRARHHALVFLDLASAAGARNEDRSLRFPVTASDREGAARALGAVGIAEGEPIVAVHPGASKLPRAWHPDRYARLARETSRTIGGRGVIVGSSHDSPLAAEMTGAGPDSLVDLTGRTSVREMAAVLERARMFIGCDSGPMHVAAAMGTPVLAIFGPGTAAKTAPFVDPRRYRVVTRSFPCSPCSQSFFRECEPAPSGKPWCIEEITVEHALEAAADLLRSTA
jgi:heptosyltransferase II